MIQQSEFAVGDRVYSTDPHHEGLGTVVQDVVNAADNDVSVLLDPPARQSGVGYWYLRRESVKKCGFREGDRVLISTGDSFDGKSGEVVEILPWPAGVEFDYLVQINKRTDPVSFKKSELRLAPKRRLTIRPKHATTAAQFDGETDLTGPDPIAADAVIIEGDFAYEVEEIDPTAYVQVDYSGGKSGYAPTYTYIDPTGGELNVGDEVEVPVTYGTKVGVVVGHGRGAWTGDCKTVLARIERKPL